MRNQISRTVAVVLTVSMLLSFASCRQKTPKKEGKFIAADSPWYNSEVIDVDLGIDLSRSVDALFPRFAGADDNYICVFVDGWYKVTNWNSIKANADYMIKNVVIVDRKTNQTYKMLDLYKVLDGGNNPENVYYSDGKICVKCCYWESETNTYYRKDYTIDPDTETVTESYTDDYEMNMQAFHSFNVGEYRIESIYNPLVTPVCCSLKVFSPDGSITDIDIAAPSKSYYEVPVIFALDDNTVLIPVAVSMGYDLFELDLTTCEVTECDAKEYEWLDMEALIHSYSSTDGKVFYTTENGISKIDIRSGTEEDVLDYSWCGVNRLYLSDADIVEFSDDSIILCGQYNSTNMFTSVFVRSFAIVELTKADENPNAGKQIMELYVADGQIDPIISDAVIQFNDTNPDYYIEFSDRYDTYDYIDYIGIENEDDYESEYLEASSELSDELAVDIINGEGPDIIMNAGSLSQLNNDNCLVDLMPCLTELDQNKYFTNIINGAKTGDKLYQLPVCFTINGIQTDPAYAGVSGVGFTTDEYEQFLDDALNGTDVIASGQTIYFAKLFTGMNDEFIKDGKIDVNGPVFSELADYVKENVPEQVKQDGINIDDVSPEEYNLGTNWQTACYCNCPGISGYLVKKAQITNGTAILGIPSTDGRGPMFGSDTSVAISSNAVNADACIEFVRILLSDEIQTELAFSDKFVLDRDAFREACGAAVEYFNTEEGSQNIFDYEQGTYVSVLPTFTEDDIDNLEKVILSCSKIDSNDAAINVILIEEMPAYFLDQKSLDDVVTIIQDRAQKVLDERG